MAKKELELTVVGCLKYSDGTCSPYYTAEELGEVFPRIGELLTWNAAKAVAAYHGYTIERAFPLQPSELRAEEASLPRAGKLGVPLQR